MGRGREERRRLFLEREKRRARGRLVGVARAPPLALFLLGLFFVLERHSTASFCHHTFVTPDTSAQQDPRTHAERARRQRNNPPPPNPPPPPPHLPGSNCAAVPDDAPALARRARRPAQVRQSSVPPDHARGSRRTEEGRRPAAFRAGQLSRRRRVPLLLLSPSLFARVHRVRAGRPRQHEEATTQTRPQTAKPIPRSSPRINKRRRASLAHSLPPTRPAAPLAAPLPSLPPRKKPKPKTAPPRGPTQPNNTSSSNPFGPSSRPAAPPSTTSRSRRSSAASRRPRPRPPRPSTAPNSRAASPSSTPSTRPTPKRSSSPRAASRSPTAWRTAGSCTSRRSRSSRAPWTRC